MSQRLFGPNGFVDAEEQPDGTVTILWAGLPYYAFHRGNSLEKNIGIALLAAIGLARRDIQRLFAVSRATVKRILAIWRTAGIEGLKDYRPGAPSLDAELKEFVIDEFKKLEGQWGYQTKILTAVKQRFQKAISRQALYMMVREYREQREGIASETEEKESRREQRNTEGQEQKAQEERREQDHPHRSEEDPGRAETTAVDCGGALVSAVCVEEFQTLDSIPESDGREEQGERFTNREMAFAYLALNAAKVVVVEQDFKQLPSHLMGGILCREKLPSLSLYRSRIPTVVQQMDMPEVIRQTARRVVQVFGFSQVLYVDGHFVPYYGEAAVLGNYSSQKRLVMPGREYFWVHDESGTPVYATISDGYRKMRFYLTQLNRDLQWIYRANKRELLLVFDRGGYSKGFCVGLSDEVRFICWRTDARVTPKVTEWEKVEVVREGNEWDEPHHEWFQAWEREVEFREGEKSRMFREVWVRKGEKVSPAVTNDLQMPLGDVVRNLVRRWGAQENGFKKLKAHGIDRIHSYLKEPYSEEYLYHSGLEQREEGIRREVDNPRIKELNKKIVKVKSTINRHRDARERAEKKGNTTALTKIKGKLAYLKRRLNQLQTLKGKEPEKVLLHQIIEQKGIERIASEKKLFFDWLKMAAMWSRKRIVDIVKPYYGDLRDVEKFVDSILQSRTYVHRADGVMYVEFPNQHSRQKQQALEQLCEELNKCESIDIGLSINKLVFSVR